ncbi:hypothetical protein IW140_002194 [Coemansia sp. RSA 1813]|nr:hypothetical protein LPJ74_003352 [Coemansia sp. RSA 1843]KAJ2090165.1 hypothetical protein IW138_002796 [Coemansia sp. RSA 986]KAJ2214572.1 hypothetical protein EV179_002830 [Coemansia sp. RSA 487]KAJ2570767.1 hypothetical protein IW140_002194 [Coemansia sp. RSA 1813]
MLALNLARRSPTAINIGRLTRSWYTTTGSLPTKAESQELFDRINTFWFAESDRLHTAGKPSFQGWWFQQTPAIDEQIADRFSADHSLVVGTKAHVDHAKESASGTLALIVLLDQMGRNMYRGSARAFSGDSIARSLAMYMVRRKFHQQLRLVKQAFVYMPLMHAEDIEAQDLSVQMYTELADRLGEVDKDDVRTNGFGGYAEMHRNVIRDFGRFPSRNAALGRESTSEELEWLKSAPF